MRYERLLLPRCGRVQWQSFTQIEQYVDCYAKNNLLIFVLLKVKLLKENEMKCRNEERRAIQVYHSYVAIGERARERTANDTSSKI